MAKMLASWFVVIVSAISLGACQPSVDAEQKLLQDKIVDGRLALDLKRVQNARVLFSHHSVGGNLLSGIAQLAASTSSADGFELISLEQAATKPGPAWLDVSGGRNGDPKSKVDFFTAAIQNQELQRPQLAFMKFCFVDFSPYTDVNEVFGHYERTLSTLKRLYPDIVFAHVTVPLTTRPREFKWRLFRLIGKMVWEDDANVKRQQFNQRLLETFSSDPIFDLARAESTKPDGSRETFERAGSTYYALEPSYSDDGGHLNPFGQRILGAEMLRFVSRTLENVDGNRI